MSEIYMTDGRKRGRGGCSLKRHIKADKLQQFLTVHVNDQARPLSLYLPLSLPRALCLIAQSLALALASIAVSLCVLICMNY